MSKRALGRLAGDRRRSGGVCFVPFERAEDVLESAQRLAKREAERPGSGMALEDWIKL